jgi:phosphatidylglycerophosphate synthase
VGKTWDSRVANALVRPLRDTAVHPNHVTTVGLLVGLAGAAWFARGDRASADLGALLYVASAIVDHADGELARMTGKTSEFGHAYDRACDLAVKLSTFVGMGLGLRHGPLGRAAPVLGLAAGAALVAIFRSRSELARRRGREVAFRQPSAGGFEIEDVLYVIAPITWAGLLSPFLVAAGIGAPLFAALTVAQLLRVRREDAEGGA